MGAASLPLHDFHEDRVAGQGSKPEVRPEPQRQRRNQPDKTLRGRGCDQRAYVVSPTSGSVLIFFKTQVVGFFYFQNPTQGNVTQRPHYSNCFTKVASMVSGNISI